MIKKEIRKNYLAKRKEITEKERMKLDDRLLIQFQKVALNDPQLLFTYFPMSDAAEPNTQLFVGFLQHMIPNLKIGYPVTNLRNYTMDAYLATEETEFEKNSYGLIEPSKEQPILPQEIDLIFVPLLAADQEGFRVGFGKGIYDKYLANCRPDAQKIGFSYFPPIDKILDINDYDVSLDVLVTPEKLYYF